MEKFLLRTLFAGDKLDIVDEEQICHAVFAAEGLHVAFLDGGDQFVGEIFALDIDDAEIRMVLVHDIADCVQQVGLAQTGLAIDKQGIVVFRRAVGHRDGSGMGKFVGRTDDKVFKGIFIVEG